MMSFTLATLRLGKTSVDAITRLNAETVGVKEPAIQIPVICTQVPTDFSSGHYVLIWLGSDNSKGQPTAWKQGFKAVGRVIGVNRTGGFQDSCETIVSIGYIFPEAVNRLDILREAPTAYYWASAVPIIGLDDHSNQTIRIIDESEERSEIPAVFYALNAVSGDFFEAIAGVYPELSEAFGYTPPSPVGEPVIPEAMIQERITGGANHLLYGVPGSGKSYTVKTEYCNNPERMERVVFHPDYTYSDFVGQILPRTDGENISYTFVPGPFTKLLKKAYHNPANEYFLIVEEINRGNAPAIFGEVFQLLDRTADGVSEYAISNSDIASVVYGNPGRMVELPSNFNIVATMNTSDQNVFTLDTAFQRRWRMRMIENDLEKLDPAFANHPILDTSVTWRQFNAVLNTLILETNTRLSSSEDKRLGTHFVSVQDIEFDANEDNADAAEKERKKAAMQNSKFPEKVLKYLWDDAFKFSREEVFEVGEFASLEAVVRKFKVARGNERLAVFKDSLRGSLI